jgi:pumilio family protein 6
MTAKIDVNNKKHQTSKKRKHENFTSNDKSKSSNTKFNSQDTSSTPSNKKRALKHSRQSHRPHADSVIQSKDLWNKLRLKTNSKKDVEQMMQQLMTLLDGKFYRVAMQHDASRIVQAALQYGNDEQRRIVVKELCEGNTDNKNSANSKTNGGQLVEIAKGQYSHFVILKIIKYCFKDDEVVKLVVKNLKGHMTKLAVHAVAARVVELLFSTFPTKATTLLKLELYGPRFALFESGEFSNTSTATSSTSSSSQHPTLSSILQSHPNEKDSTLSFLLNILNKGIEKSLFGFAYFAGLLCDYVTNAPKNDVQSFASSLVDHSIHLLSTKAGSRVVAECAAYGTAKDRKRLIKSLKGFARKGLLHADAYIAIIRIVDVTDDTVNVQKSILSELLIAPDTTTATATANTLLLDGKDQQKEEEEKDTTDQSPLLELALNETSSKLFLYLLVKDDDERKKYFHPSELEILHSNPCVTDGQDSKPVPTSKKNPNTRRGELLQYMKNSLVDLCQKHTDVLMRSRNGSRILNEVVSSFPSEDIYNSVVQACDHSNDDDGDILSIFEDPVGHLTLKNLIMKGNDDSANKSKLKSIAYRLNDKYHGSLLDTIGKSNRGAFVLAAMVASPDVGGKVKKELEQKKDVIEKLINDGSSKKEKENKKNKKMNEEKAKTMGSKAGYMALLNSLAS